VKNFLQRAAAMGDKLGPVLFQLPPNWKTNPERLAGLLKILPREYNYAFEFRDGTWFNEEIYGLLQKFNAAFCIYDFAGLESPRLTTANFVYIRLHGPEDSAYTGRYSEEALEDYAGFLDSQSAAGKDVYCYFDNDQAGYAPQDAARLASKTKNIDMIKF
jgi:uncharacterized protein YecE (DUF72 family)